MGELDLKGRRFRTAVGHLAACLAPKAHNLSRAWGSAPGLIVPWRPALKARFISRAIETRLQRWFGDDLNS